MSARPAAGLCTLLRQQVVTHIPSKPISVTSTLTSERAAQATRQAVLEAGVDGAGDEALPLLLQLADLLVQMPLQTAVFRIRLI